MTTAYESGTEPPILVQHRLRIAREFAGLEQEELADLIGVSRNTVGNAEKGRVKPRKITLNAWALVCGVPVSWLECGRVKAGGPTDPTTSVGPLEVVEIPPTGRVVVFGSDGEIDEESTKALAPLADSKPLTLRLTAECSARLSYRGPRRHLRAVRDYSNPPAKRHLKKVS
ncbi:hypothetical protein LAUMK4_05891 [Mycobacterium persicum]|uniref:HTH cro/C1-type domain-containing protein n=1 Tax=Mycobacterium persicum TaxID=1487726 RepID=A0ABY6RSU4_9MYCO|nr:helix-turn-helix transcriptional regulator [Mycobacterium persicum]VBA33135.1 hypothetical protein LAUMK4_05891 [Mycobacterium persicum]